MEKILYIVRGIPGSGKSTFAKSLGGIHWEADMFFTDPFTGEYNFDPSKIKSAHEWCQLNVKDNMIDSENRIVVSNTFTQEWEMQPYYDIAKEFGYKVFSIVVENRHDGVNVHSVPEDKIEIMRGRFEIKL
jgi:hypothetical protein